MLIDHILSTHDSFRDGLSLNIGDGYLLAKNSVFAAMRRTALDCGASFSTDNESIAPLYKGLSFFSLPFMLEAGVVAYLDNVTPLRMLSRASERLVVDPSVLLRSLHPNPLLHETAHLVAARKRNRYDASDLRAQLCEALLSEAYATSVQTYSALGAVESDVGSLLCDLNGVFNSVSLRDRIEALAQSIGLTRSLASTIVGGYVAQCGGSAADSKWLLGVTLGVSDLQGVEHACGLGFGQSPFFAVDMQAAYFGAIGLEDEFEKLRADPSQFIRATGDYSAERIRVLATFTVESMEAAVA